MNLTSLKYFVAVVEHNNFTKAAEHLFVTQPTLSRQVADLEKELGVQLFIRENRKLVLTEAGKICLEEAQKIIRLADNMVNKIKAIQNEKELQLNIGYLMPLQGIINSAIMEFNKSFREININMISCSYNEMCQLFSYNELDAMFTSAKVVSDMKSIKSIKISENELLLMISENHALAKRDSIKMSDLKNEKFIMMEQEISPLSLAHILEMGDKIGFKLNVSRYVRDMFTLFLLVSSGKGLSFISSDALLSVKVIPGIKILKIEDFDIDVSILLAYNPDNKNPALITFLKEMKNKFLL